MAVDVIADRFVDDLPEEHRTCVYRIVQEAISQRVAAFRRFIRQGLYP